MRHVTRTRSDHLPPCLHKLARYEVHLDRKLERTLGMLLRLQELRRTITPDAAA